MGEEKITITIDEEGRLHLETRGIKGPVCLDEARALLAGVAITTQVSKTDEYYEGPKAKVRPPVKLERDRT